MFDYYDTLITPEEAAELQVRRAIRHNPDIRLVVRDVSGGMI